MEIVPVDYSVGDLVSEIVNMIWLKTQEKGLEFHPFAYELLAQLVNKQTADQIAEGMRFKHLMA